GIAVGTPGAPGGPAQAPAAPRAGSGVAPRLALVLAAVAYGSTFIVVQRAIATTELFGFLAVRFAIATVVLVPFASLRGGTGRGRGGATGWRHGASRARWSRGELGAGLAAGVPLLAGYVAQTVGLRHVTTPVSAFLTDLLVVFVPLVGAVALARLPDLRTATGIVVATAGLYLITGARLSLSLGEMETVACALAFAVNLVVIGEVASRYDTARLVLVQMAVVSAGSAVVALATSGPGALVVVGAPLAGAVYTAVVASAAAFGLQVYGQKRVASSSAALLLMVEPVTAAAVGYGVGQPLGATGAAGAALILAGVAVSELRRNRGGPSVPVA
ncbi:MAG: DMT family transporter, partial [Acidimicrobiales bacterium]